MRDGGCRHGRRRCCCLANTWSPITQSNAIQRIDDEGDKRSETEKLKEKDGISPQHVPTKLNRRSAENAVSGSDRRHDNTRDDEENRTDDANDQFLNENSKNEFQSTFDVRRCLLYTSPSPRD